MQLILRTKLNCLEQSYLAHTKTVSTETVFIDKHHEVQKS